jgi:uncharacterized protein
MANRLANEQSPYLQQHAQNPVDWYPWGEEAFERAKKENKPVIVSIGYSACHWCHVMERESFEDEQTARYMNEHFINVKVDREEHPDVDHLYMDAVQAISGSGGWPLNVFVTPERLPFYGGTYFPPRPAFNRPSWIELLQRMNEIWVEKQEDIATQTEQMLQYLKQASQISFPTNGSIGDKEACSMMAANLLKQADKQHGGFGKAPKFPGTMAISFLLEQYHFTKNKEALDHAVFSLEAMIKGGIYDQVGGGFARYSTDEQWLAPHFEKMLYDNALLIISLCDAYQLTQGGRFKETIEETIAFVETELRDETGLYYSALDADSEGVEGKFYTWTWDEWNEVLQDKILERYFGIEEHGNWEHTNILHEAVDKEELAREAGISKEELGNKIKQAKEALFSKRAGRIRPSTDDKVLLSWNALMNLALTRAGIALQREDLLERAEQQMEVLVEYFHDGELKHVWKKGVARIEANLDDYAYLIQALLQLASATGNNRWIAKANELCEIVMKEFQHENGSFFYYTSFKQKDIPVRKVDIYDGATPSANAVMAHNLMLLGMCMERAAWIEQAEHMLQQMSETAAKYTYSFSYWSILIQRYVAEPKTIVITGKASKERREELRNYLLPDCYVVTSEKEISDMPILKDKRISDESLIFVCTHQACLAPVHTVGETLQIVTKD